ncbi:MAG TPA: DUF5689 domain-containing protein, partial [Dysgonamonadaceae bacterium]|nr:DUF5689 domain-containing protein [Dysgonamonadaceae bacterium]
DDASLEYITIKDVRNMYIDSGKSEMIIDEPMMLKAVVISDRIGANRSAKRDGYLQDEDGNGLAFRVTQNETPFDMGDELIINLKGAKVHYFDYAGIVQLIFSKMDTEVIDQDVVTVPKVLTIEELQNGLYDGTLVKIKNVQFKEYKELQYYSGEGNATSRLLESVDGDVINVKTTKSASFKNETLPKGKGNIVAIASFCKESWELQLRNLDDAQEMSDDVSTRFKQKEPPVESTQIAVANLRAKLKDGGIYTEDNYIEGEVILNAFNGNVPNNEVFLADGTAGVSLSFSDKENVLANVPIGAKVKVQLKGLKAKVHNGLLQIGDNNTLTTQAVAIIEEKASAALQPKVATIDELLLGKYQSELVRVENVQFKEVGMSYAASPSIVDRVGKEVHVCTRVEADFADDVVKEGMGAFVGVVNFNKTPLLLIRSIDDLAGMTEDRFDANSTFIIPNKNEIAFDGYGGVESVTIAANVNWYALSDGAWLSITPISGENDGVVNVSANRNEGEERKATIVITDGEITKTIEVAQKCASESGELATDLFISEYVMGSSYNKYLELYNGTGKVVDLSDYKVELYSNKSTTVSSTEFLMGYLENGEVVVLKHAKAAIYDGDAIISNVANFNGDDAIALVKVIDDADAIYVDIIGCIGERPEKGWVDSENKDITTYQKTLVRKPSVRGGVTKNPEEGFPTLGVEWIVYPKDTSDYLGSHTMD